MIATYVINLERRMDRKIHIENEFSKYSQFDLQVFKAIEDDIPAIGLYRSLISIVQKAKKQALPYVLICEDGYTFITDFNFENFKDDLERLQADRDKESSHFSFRYVTK